MVRVVTNDGTVVTGRLLNIDTFTVQLLGKAIRAKICARFRAPICANPNVLPKSAMPSYKDKLSPQELADVVSYLASLKVGKPWAICPCRCSVPKSVVSFAAGKFHLLVMRIGIAPDLQADRPRAGVNFRIFDGSLIVDGVGIHRPEALHYVFGVAMEIAFGIKPGFTSEIVYRSPAYRHPSAPPNRPESA